MEDLNWNWLQNLYHELQWKFQVGPIDKVVCYVQIKLHALFSYFWGIGKVFILSFQV
jgi:hypothetical protein